MKSKISTIFFACALAAMLAMASLANAQTTTASEFVSKTGHIVSTVIGSRNHDASYLLSLYIEESGCAITDSGACACVTVSWVDPLGAQSSPTICALPYSAGPVGPTWVQPIRVAAGNTVDISAFGYTATATATYNIFVDVTGYW